MLQKQPVNINFSEGLNTKTDKWQLPVGQFLSLDNSVFTTQGRLTKRNGFGKISSVVGADYLTTLNGNLTAIGSTLQAYSAGNESWVTKGNLNPITLSTLPVGRSAINQIQCDSVISANNLVCTVYTERNNSTSNYYYNIRDSNTGQAVVNPTLIPAGSGAITGSPRVFLLGGFFIIVFTNTLTATPHLQYVAISTSSPTTVTAPADIAATYAPSSTVAWDGVVYGTQLFIAYNTTSGGQAIDFVTLNQQLLLSAATTFVNASWAATMMSVCVDTSQNSAVIYASFYSSGSSTGYVLAVDSTLAKRMSPTQIISSGTVNNITCAAQNGVVTTLYEVNNAYSYDSSIKSDFIDKVAVTLPLTVTTGTVGSTTTILRSVGLASKSFIYNSVIYTLVTYQSVFQNTYFLIDSLGNIYSRFAYENGGGYLTLGLPQAQVIGSTANIAYLYKDLIETLNTTQNANGSGAPNVSNVYSQTGVNLVGLDFTTATQNASEIGSSLNITGGMLWSYDGQTVSEQGFHLFPDSIECTWSTTGGSIHAQPDGATNTNAYYYQVTYEWTDANGNINRSASSVPVSVTTTGSGTAGSITVNVPYLRLTYKSNVKIVIYRWSVANQEYYQVTSITAPTLNVTTSDSIAYVDTLADSSIIGNNIIYTTGGVIEDIAGPAAVATALFDDRLWLIDAEDRNLLWFSKQVIEGTPVEMSDLSTFYVAPSTGAQGSTGPLTCIFPMDDKLILFKQDAVYYINGSGPDNTDSNNQYSQPIFITSSVGCANQNSIVLIPGGLMFQSDKGIWLIGRDLSTNYIGAPVEAFNSVSANSAVNIPATTQVRFTLDTGVQLMYDYFFDKWGTFSGASAISSTLYQSLHTLLRGDGAVLQETPGTYLDAGEPTLMSFLTSWLNLAGLQGYQMAYEYFLLGEYLSPHILRMGVAYDYNASIYQSDFIMPTNFNSSAASPFGDQPSPFGASTSVEPWRVFLAQKRCSAIQISFNEIYDPTYGVTAGAGLTLSGINLVVAVKAGWRTQSQGNTVGSGQNRG